MDTGQVDAADRQWTPGEPWSSRAQLATILAGIADGITVQDAGGRLVYANDAAARLVGYPSARALLAPRVGDVVRDFALADEAGRPLAPDQLPGRLTLRDGQPREATLCFRRLPDGEERWSHVRATVVHDERGRLRSVINLFVDVTERKRAEAARAQLAAIVDSSDDAIIGKTLAGTITSWNAAAERLYGYTAAEAVGRPIALIIPPHRPDELPSILARLARGERVEPYETERLAKDGRHLAVSLAVSPIRDGAGRVVGASAIARDITERQRAGAALRASEQRYRLLMEQASDGIFLADGAGRYVAVNRRGCEMLGYSEAELLALRSQDLILDEDRVAAPPRLGELHAGHTVLSERRLRRKDGTPLPVEISARLLSDGTIMGIVRDIGDRMRAAETLRQSEARFRALIQHATDVVTITDAQGVYRYVSPAVERVLGYRPEDVVGTVGFAPVHPDDAVRARRFFGALVAVPRAIRSIALRLRHADGSWRHVEAVASNLLDEPGIDGIVANYRDVTEGVEANQHLERRVVERTRELATLLDISHTVASTLELKPLLGLILEQLAAVVAYTGAAIWTIVGEELAVEEYRGPLPPEQAARRRLPLEGVTAYRETKRHGRPVVVIVDDVRDGAASLRLLERSDNGAAPSSLVERRTAAHSLQAPSPVPDYARCLLSVPLLVQEHVLGILRLEASTPRFYTAHHA